MCSTPARASCASRGRSTRGQIDAGAVEIALRLEGDALVGRFVGPEREFALRATRGTRPTRPARPVVDFAKERPEVLTLDGLPDEFAQQARLWIVDAVESGDIVGLSAAFVVAGEVADVRSFGWEDYHEDVPASDTTMYRWASISKPLTAVAALQLVARGALDLDRDVRAYVPEWPEKAHVITARKLLCHQAGVVHYDMRPRTLRTYDTAHPWADAILRLDMFNESDVKFEPGTRYAYSTPGFVLLGAVVERAGAQSFVEQVTARTCAPLGMTTMQPDYQWVDIAHRATGYQRDGDAIVRSDDDNIAWKLPAGGWVSSVTDLARFGAGLIGGDILTEESRALMWEEQRLADGRGTGKGLGIGVGTVGGERAVFHSGGQNKASTYLVCAPERRLAVALMCNTQGISLRGLAERLLAAMIERGL